MNSCNTIFLLLSFCPTEKTCSFAVSIHHCCCMLSVVSVWMLFEDRTHLTDMQKLRQVEGKAVVPLKEFTALDNKTWFNLKVFLLSKKCKRWSLIVTLHCLSTVLTVSQMFCFHKVEVILFIVKAALVLDTVRQRCTRCGTKLIGI